MPRERPELREQIDAPRGARILSGRLEGRGELGSLRLEQLARLRAVDRREGAGDVAVAQVDRREHDRARLERAPRLGPLLARGLHPRLAELVTQGHRARDPVARRLDRVGHRGVARLEQPPVHRDPLERAGVLDVPSPSDRVAHPGVERGQVTLRLRAIGVGAEHHREVVERTGAPLVAAQRELARGSLDRVAPGGPEGALQRFVGAHEIEAAAHRREAAIGRARLESLVRARHLPRLDRSESHGALGRPGLADEEVMHRGGEGVVADRCCRGRDPLGARDRRLAPTGRAALENQEKRREPHKACRSQHSPGSLHGAAT